MFFTQTSLGARTDMVSRYVWNTPATRPTQTFQLFGEHTSLVLPRLGFLGIFAGEPVSPYFHYSL